MLFFLQLRKEDTKAKVEELIDKALNGDEYAYSKLFDSISSDLRKIASARLSNIEDIEEAIIETMYESFDSLHTLKEKQYFKTWVIKILIYKCNDIHRYNYRHLRLIEKLTNLKESMNAKSYEHNIERRLDYKELLKKLKYEERIVFILHYNNEYSVGEIADILNENVNTIKSRLLRSRKKLEFWIKEVDDDGRK